MAEHHEIHELLEHIRKELPGHTHGAYEQAVKRTMRHPRWRQGQHRGHGRPMGWAMLEQMLFPGQHRHQQEEEGAIGLFMLIVGLIGGAALMYLFDPERGAQRRAVLMGEVSKVAHEAETKVEEVEQRVRTEVEEVAEHVRDDVEKVVGEAEEAAKHVGKAASGAGQEVEGEVTSAAAETKKRAEGGLVSARNLIARIQSELKTLVSDPSAVEVTVKNGVVTLSGKIHSREVQALVEQIQLLPGVSSIENHLEVHDATDNAASAPNNLNT